MRYFLRVEGPIGPNTMSVIAFSGLVGPYDVDAPEHAIDRFTKAVIGRYEPPVAVELLRIMAIRKIVTCVCPEGQIAPNCEAHGGPQP